MDDTAEEAAGYLNSNRDVYLLCDSKGICSVAAAKIREHEMHVKDLFALIKYTADEDKDEKILENQKVLKSPVVRNGKRLRQIISRISGKSGSDRKTRFCLIKVLNFLLYRIIL